ncbi:phosphatase PAP2 family protein [Actinokineospora inagensis]|uniref:phosphatase PAP2 family protein n=1 Tax=Actinokineospora inagensis TaxID=103730 RepID=UPI000410EFB7|nr:phosphatase PAP2 family protein [Actinokineospora inagensis]
MLFAALGVLLIGLFLLLGGLVSASPPGIDRAVADTLGADWRGTAGDIAHVGSMVLGPVLPVVVSVALLVAALVNRARARVVGLLLRCVALIWVCRTVSLVKPLFDRARPREYPEFSYPSGHVVSVSSVAVAAIVLCAWLAPRWLRLVVVGSSVAVAVTALFRVLLDVHWFTDVLGGALGVAGVGLLAASALRLLPARSLGG